MYVNDRMILELLALLKSHGVRHVVVSPGSRHYPIVRSLESDEAFQLFSVVDERSAGFFALGLIRAVNRPVAVLSTSGTAAVNYGSAVAEAFHQKLPLVVLTADRPPEFLDQLEDQMVDQSRLFGGAIRFTALLRPVREPVEEWYVNRIVNEALLALRRDGGGPVHINVPIGSHAGLRYDVAQLPEARVIRRHSAAAGTIDWAAAATRLAGKRVMVLWGQGVTADAVLMGAIDRFTAVTDSAIMTDHIGNLHHERVIAKAYELLRSALTRPDVPRPEVLISVGGRSVLLDRVKGFLGESVVEHWSVCPDGDVVDPFWRLTDIFQTPEREFFAGIAAALVDDGRAGYAESLRRAGGELPEISVPYGEVHVIGQLLAALPPGSALHLGNSAPVRMAHLFEVPPSVTVFGNRGVNGIDGSMSSAVGYAAGSDALTFLIIGDLSFFYDMNSLAIRHVPKNLRVLLVNNGGGALMHDVLPAEAAEQAAVHISAGHEMSASGWSRSRGFRYLGVSDPASLSSALEAFVDDAGDRPFVIEAFTEKVADIEHFRARNRSLSGATPGPSAYRRVRRRAGRLLRGIGLLR